MFDITISIDNFGQGNSFTHQVHPAIKLIIAFILVAVNSLYNNLSLSFTLSILCVVLILGSNVGIKRLGIYYLFIILMVIGLSIMYTLFLGFSLERILTVWINLSSIGLPIIYLMLTTPIIKTLYGFEAIFHPLTYLKIPVNGIILICTIALSFIPTVVSELQRILYAMAVRGSDIRYQSFPKKCKTIMHALVPLLISTLTTCENLASAISVKNYNAFNRRTNIYQQDLRFADIGYGCLIIGIIIICATVL